MLYVNNAFSTKMVDYDCNVKIEFVSEDYFRASIPLADEVVIGYKDTGDYFGVPVNRKTIHLDKGDVLLVCEANSKDGGRLPSGTEFLSQMGDGVYFRFIKVIVE